MNTSLLSSNAKEVSKKELRGLHTRNGMMLYDGDEITVADNDTVAVEPLIINGEQAKTDDGHPIVVYKIECRIKHRNGSEVEKLVPLGTFTKRPAEDGQTFFGLSDLLRDLGQAGDDLERFETLKRYKRFKVDGFHDGKATDWRVPKPVDGSNRPLVTAKFPILRELH